MEQQSEWIEVERSEIEKADANERSMVVRVSVSPYDVPLHVRGAFDEARRRFVIEFQYVDSEPTRELRVGDHAVAVVGRNSGKVYSLELDVDSLRVDAIGLEMAHHAMRDLVGTISPQKARKKNYALAQSVIDAYWKPLSAILSKANTSSHALAG